VITSASKKAQNGVKWAQNSDKKLKVGDEQYDKHHVLGLRKRLEKFIFEEKEKTLMN